MSFRDLPPDWEEQPVTDPQRAADVLDLFVPSDMRQRGALYLLLCDGADRVLQPCAVETLPDASAGDRRQDFFLPFVEILTRLAPNGAVLVALARPDGLSITSSDLEWQAAAAQVCRAGGVRLLGTHLLTLHGSRVIPPL